MSDKKFTKVLSSLLVNARDLTSWGIAGGHTTESELRLTVLGRKAEAKRIVASGVSQRKAAEALGVDEKTVRRDMRQNAAEGAAKCRASKPKTPKPKPALPAGKFSTLVIDPPWPMTKIERDVRPNQVGFDYPVMSEQQLMDFWGSIQELAGEDCHMFMWTTQKFLPLAMKLIDHYGFRYILTMVWHKPGGYQPTGLPQFNCEFVVYARKGTPKFIDTKGFPCCFNAPRREHSRKPDEFYDIVSLVTSGPRIDVFSREKRDGFEQFGNESEAF